MPLQTGKSKAARAANIHELVKSGYPVRQAVAIALHKSGYKKKKKT